MAEIVTRHENAVRPVSKCIGVSGRDCSIQLFVQFCFVFDLEVSNDLRHVT